MVEKAKIPPGGLIALLYSFHVMATIFPISGLAVVAKSSAWISSIVAGGGGLVAVWIWLAARPAQHDTPMPDWIVQVCGRVLGVLINGLYLLFFLIMCGITMRHVVELVSTAILPRTPNVLLLFLFAVPAAIAARLGIEVITRSAQVYIGFGIVAFVLLSLGISPYVHMENFLPVVAEGVRPVLSGAIPSIAALSLTGLGIWAAPYLRDRATLSRVSTLAAMSSGVAVIVVTSLAQGLFSYRGMGNMLIPALAVARSVRLGRILERLDVALLGAWLLLAFLSITFLIYLSSIQLAWLGRTRQYRPFALPVTIIAATMAMVLVRSDAELSEWVNSGAFAPYVLFHTVVVPVTILLLRWIRKDQLGQKDDAKREGGD